MKKEVRSWIEGKGIIPTVFRALALWEYSTEEQARQQLMKVIERGNHTPGPYILQYAIDQRKKEIQWPFLYLPLFAHLLLSLFVIMGGLFSQKPWGLSVSVAIVNCLIFIFRNTWFSKYSEACRFILPGMPFRTKCLEKGKRKGSRQLKTRKSRFNKVNRTFTQVRNLTWNRLMMLRGN